MPRVLLIEIRFHDGRYHGTGDWPPAPARLFQALVAGIGQRGPLGARESEPLEWMESLSQVSPPLIASPYVDQKRGQAVNLFVPNNDLDAVGGDARRIGSIRTLKIVKPKLFDVEVPLLYAWTYESDEHAESMALRVCASANHLYQLGRGVDQAWACGEIVDSEKLEARLMDYQGEVRRPAKIGNGQALMCPRSGSLESLKRRHAAMGRRFKTEVAGGSVSQRFSKVPKPIFYPVYYDCPPQRMVFDLRSRESDAEFFQWPLCRAYELVVALRDGAAGRLRNAEIDDIPIEKCLVGRKANGDHDAPKSARIRIIPLPSIGHHHADRAIRRIIVEVPSGCMVRAGDVYWAFSGLQPSRSESGESYNLVVTPAADESMSGNYGVGNPGVRWRSITPVVLPETARRRRIEPSRMAVEAKAGSERAAEQVRAAMSVVQALRHAEELTPVDTIRVQREPFGGHGERVEAFAEGTRFAKERIWHVEIAFARPVSGPLVIGDGRYLGLGLLAPADH